MARSHATFIRWFLVVVWMALIFIASADPESGAHGSRILVPILRWLFPDLPEASMDQAVFLIRKVLHFAEFGVLSVLLRRAIAGERSSLWRTGVALQALGCTALYAMSDEIHQAFVPSRTATVTDVLIDTAGAAVALGWVWLWGRLRRRW